MPNIHDHNAAIVILFLIVLVSPGQKNFCSNLLSLEFTVKRKNVDRFIAGNETSEVLSQILDVLAPTHILKKITPDDRWFVRREPPDCARRAAVQPPQKLRVKLTSSD